MHFSCKELDTDSIRSLVISRNCTSVEIIMGRGSVLCKGKATCFTVKNW